MSGYQVHPDEMSTWCRSNVCDVCEDDLCEHGCHYDDDEPTLPLHRLLLRRAVVCIGIGGSTMAVAWLVWPTESLTAFTLKLLIAAVATVRLAPLIDPWEDSDEC